MTDPTISVVMAVYNGEAYLRESIQSILDQSFRDFELIIVSEYGTSEKSLEILSSFDDPRIVHLHNQERLGLVRSLNLALSMARGRYIARMDSDDVCIVNRLERQVRFLDAHPKIAAVGCDIMLIDEEGEVISMVRYPHRPIVVRWEMYFHSAIANPSATIRSADVKGAGNYDEGTPLAEDYGLWLKLLRTTDLANLPEPLLKYRVHGQNVSTVERERSVGIANHLSGDALAELIGWMPSQEVIGCLRDRSMIKNATEGQSASDLLLELHRHYVQRHKPCWNDKVRIHAVTLRLQMAVSMRFMRSGTLTSLKALWRGMVLSPSTALPSFISAIGQLISYRRRMRLLGFLD